MRKITAFFVLVTFLFSCVMPPQGFAQTLTAVGLMPQPGTQVTLSPAFTPAHLKGMVINLTDPFKLDFIVHRGDESLAAAEKQQEYSKLVKYFLAALAVPDTDQWVNLSPYEQDRIIPDGFGFTEMGRDLLAQDYLLKQISASLTNPDTDLGKKFWDGVYAKAYEKFETTDIPTDTFNKIWIIPDKAVVYEKGNSVVVLEYHLKVMLKSDYNAMKENAVNEVADNKAVEVSKQVMRDVIIPAIEKEVNEGKSFAPLRQVYSGMLLATWYKLALKESILGKLYADKGKVKGVDQDDLAQNQKIYEQYVTAFRKGVFNMIKEDVDRYSQEVVPRKYFSGGAVNTFARPEVLTILRVLPNGAVVKRMRDGTQITMEKNEINAANLSDADILSIKLVGAGDKEFRVLQGAAPGKVSMEEGGISVDAAMNSGDTGKVSIEVLKRAGAHDLGRGYFCIPNQALVKLDEQGKIEERYIRSEANSWGFELIWVDTSVDRKGQKDIQFIYHRGLRRTFDGSSYRAWGLDSVNKKELLRLKVQLWRRSLSKQLVRAGAMEDVSGSGLFRFTWGKDEVVVVYKKGRVIFEGFLDPRLKQADKEMPSIARYTLREGLVFKDGPMEYVFDSHGGKKVISLDTSIEWDIPLRDDQRYIQEANGAGFVIGGINSNEVIDQLTEINGQTISEIEQLARPGKSAIDGFIGRQERFIDVLKFDNEFVRSRGMTHQAMAEPLFYVMNLLSKMEDKPEKRIRPSQVFRYKGMLFKVFCVTFHGRQSSILNDDLWSNRNYVVTNISNGAWIYYSALIPFYIARYGFYEGNTPYRVSPQSILDVFFSDIANKKQAGDRLVPDRIKLSQEVQEQRSEWQKDINEQEEYDKRILQGERTDDAMKVITKVDEAAVINGGIDFAQSNLDLQIKRDGAGVPLPVSQQDLDNIRIDGLVPVILNIQPAANVPLFTGAGMSTP